MKVIETERMTLRWFDENDAPFVLALLNDPAWIAGIGERNVRTLEDARRFIAERLVAHYWEKGHGFWAMVRRSDGAVVGMSGLVDRESLPEIDVGYALAPAFRGSGYAREAAAATLRYARDVLGKSRVLAIVWPENRASVRVLESLGMVSEGVRLLAGDSRESGLFSWNGGTGGDAAAAEDDPSTAIDALIRRFFAVFSNRRGTAAIAALPAMFLPEAVITVVTRNGPRGVEVLTLRDFLLPRATLLQGGGLTDFEEEEVTNRMTIVGNVAHRSSSYRKAGKRDGVPFEGGGNKHFQIVRTTKGWKIAALAWEETESAR
jgi:RimJ/RimL family protein N-acetyltransferase